MKHKLLLLFFIPYLSFSQSTLGKAKESLSKSSKSVSTTTRSSNSSSEDDDPSFFELFFESFVLELAYYTTLGVAFGSADYTEINPYPYYNGDGEYTRDFHDDTQSVNFKIGANYLASRVNGLEFNAVFKPLPIIGLEFSHVNFSEKTLLNSESLPISSFNVNYYRVREDHFSLWWGIGGTYVGDSVDTWGFSYNLGLDVYPVKPISLHVGWKQSFINDDKVNVFKSQVKYHIRKTALYTGYHNFRLGSETVSGLVLGVEYTF
ncbi:hypothetical protein [Tenacibaculum agarivorans]|uniref:hypothetical protein n=1 Tax=Tenacibaculum agarivorans TaxID=1908389 RepID=UPI00094BAE96|nr:hypothetical protein [Tenacibaculum agarivorans]